jgi:hypothetical protein
MSSNPLPDTPAHQFLMNVAFGDHQVTNFQADVEALTIIPKADNCEGEPCFAGGFTGP